jgi:hypothetical protein
MTRQEDDPTTAEDHFGRHNVVKSSGWASTIVIAIIVVVLGAVFYFSRF